MWLIAFCLGVQVFPGLATSYFFKDVLKLNPDQVSKYDAITSAIWIFKPLFGFISDSFPLCGSRRKVYLILFSLMWILCWATMSIPELINSFSMVIAIQLLIHVASGFINVIGEAIMIDISNFSATSKQGSLEIEEEID